MKQYLKSVTAFMAAILLATVSAGNIQAANTYDAQIETVSGNNLFPGDTVRGVEPVYIGPDGEMAVLENGEWKNNTEKVYGMSGYEGEGGGLWLEMKGYQLSVKNGGAAEDETHRDNHYKPRDEFEDLAKTDRSFFKENDTVHVLADTPEEGQVFDHWEVLKGDLVLDDASAEEIWFVMPARGVSLEAVYTAAPAEQTEEAAAEVYPEIEEQADEGQSFEEQPMEGQSNEEQSFEEQEADEEDDGSVVISDGTDEVIVDEAPEVYTVTVVDGNVVSFGEDGTEYLDTQGTYEAWNDVLVRAAEKEGYVFESWAADTDAVWFSDPYSSETVFSMPSADVVITAQYTAVETQAPTETEAVPDQTAEEVIPDQSAEEVIPDQTAEEVTPDQTAEEVTPDQTADEVIPDEAADEVIPDEAAEEILPDQAAEEAAVDQAAQAASADQAAEEAAPDQETGTQSYHVFVEDGTVVTLNEDGSENLNSDAAFEAMDTVTIRANEMEGRTFEYWLSENDAVWIEDMYSAETTFPMPAEDVSVKAVYSEEQPAYDMSTFSIDTLPENEQNNIVPDEAEMTVEAAEEDEVIPDASEEKSEEAAPGSSEQKSGEETPGMPEQKSGEETPETPEQKSGEETPGTPEQKSGEETPETPEQKSGEETPETPEKTPDEGTPETPEAKKYDVIVKDINGNETISSAAAGEKVQVSASDVDGFSFYYWEVTGLTVDSSLLIQQSFEFDMPENAVTLNPVYQKQAVAHAVSADGTVLGQYYEGQTVTVAASEKEGFVFDGWTAEGITLSDDQVKSLMISFTMPDNDVTLTSNFTARESYTVNLLTEGITISGAGKDGAGAYFAYAGDTVTVTAPSYEDSDFIEWSIKDSSGADLTIFPSEEDEYTASFTMPSSVVNVEAIYQELSNNEVRIINGSGSGTYTEGDYVEIAAADAPSGYRFSGWKVISGNVELDDAKSKTTGFTMPDEPVRIRAVYEQISFTLTVVNGSGSGSYGPGTKVSLGANMPADGKVFDTWKITTGSAQITAPAGFYTTLVMPSADVKVEAVYKDGPSPSYNAIQGIENNGEYLKSSTITFTAVGNGMGNTTPNPGDFRWRPTSYQIGNVSGGWNNGGYQTSMAINAVGDYTLTVTFTKDLFDGSSWVNTGVNDTKSVTFHVVTTLSVNTGDSTPIIPLVIAAAAALVVILLIVGIRLRRR